MRKHRYANAGVYLSMRHLTASHSVEGGRTGETVLPALVALERSERRLWTVFGGVPPVLLVES